MGIPSGGRTMLIMSSTNLYFMILSLAVVEVIDGEAFTCRRPKLVITGVRRWRVGVSPSVKVSKRWMYLPAGECTVTVE